MFVSVIKDGEILVSKTLKHNQPVKLAEIIESADNKYDDKHYKKILEIDGEDVVHQVIMKIDLRLIYKIKKVLFRWKEPVK